MERFSIDKKFGRISFSQFKKTAERLESALKTVRPEITSEVLLTTNGIDYSGEGSLTIETPGTLESGARKEKHQLSDLNEGLWKKSFETGLYLKDNSVKDPYMVVLSSEVREPNRLFFYAQGLDEVSQKVFNGFKNPGFLEKIGDGFHKLPSSAVSHEPKLGFLGL